MKAIIAIVCSALFISACSEEVVQTKTVIPSVKAIEVTEQNVGKERRVSGSLVAADKSQLSFAVSGTVLSVAVSPGQTVAKGDVLAKLDKKPLELALKQANGQLSIARAQATEKEKRFARMKELKAKNLISSADFEVAESELNVAKGNLRVAESANEDALSDLEKVNLVAPYDGKIVERSIDAFQEITAGSAAFVIEAEGSLEVEILVPETYIRDVDYGQAVRVTFPTVQDLSLAGYVAEVGSQVVAGNAFPVKVQLGQSEPSLRSGMSALVTFNFGREGSTEPVFLVPISALALDAGLLAEYKSGKPEKRRAPLFVFDEASSTVKSITVDVADVRGNALEVREGLKLGDKVVTAGVPFLRDGMQAKLWVPNDGLGN